MSQKHALLTTIPSDSHFWNLIFLQMHLEEAGWQVTNLGSCVPIETNARAAKSGDYDLIAVSTVNGHGYLEGVELGWELADLTFEKRPKLVIGGKLGLDHETEHEHAKSLAAAGFDAVFHGPSAIPAFDAFLQKLDRPEPITDSAAAWKLAKPGAHTGAGTGAGAEKT